MLPDIPQSRSFGAHHQSITGTGTEGQVREALVGIELVEIAEISMHRNTEEIGGGEGEG